MLYGFPLSSVADLPYVARRDPELGSHGHLRAAARTDCSDLFDAQLVVRLGFTLDLASLRRTITHVVELRTKEQMRRLNTRRRVAMMQDTLARRDGAVGAFPCDAMGQLASAGPSVALPVVRRVDPQTAAVGVRWGNVVLEDDRSHYSNISGN